MTSLKYTTKQCPICGTTFQTHELKQKTCGKACGIIQCSRSRTRAPEQAASLFWSRVNKSGGQDACWLWTAGTNGSGYGSMYWRGKDHRAHRIAWELTHGPIPDGLHVLHDCPDGDNPRCVNPAHLWLGTHQDNVDDRERKGRNRPPRGENHVNCKLTDAQVAEIRRRYAAGGTSHRKLAAEFGVSKRPICRILRMESRADGD